MPFTIKALARQERAIWNPVAHYHVRRIGISNFLLNLLPERDLKTAEELGTRLLEDLQIYRRGEIIKAVQRKSGLHTQEFSGYSTFVAVKQYIVNMIVQCLPS